MTWSVDPSKARRCSEICFMSEGTSEATGEHTEKEASRATHLHLRYDRNRGAALEV